ncbi:Golgi-associated plant pathogenesis-related protein 1-like [Asterias rubens]|uniref:Golgi-associated plant pathogenesis-related protein 1-like n=1 Tax=Asterias rubens TaxID=7604 RepID=UPI001455B074|nr:Golgi-associated plant pathogenesis-related protein 1-like [Asterias rubens]
MGCGGSTVTYWSDDTTYGPHQHTFNGPFYSSMNGPTGRFELGRNLERIRWEVLEMHNVYRARHGVQPLVLSGTINNIAQSWAETMARIGKLEHSPKSSRPDCGENIHHSWSTAFDINAVTGGEAVKSFYDEIEDYDFNKPGEKPASGKVIGHFTALVWKDSKELGVGVATSKKGKWGHVYICCNYTPRGNWRGAENYRDNVLPPTSGYGF